jgi:deoxyadenosine/deoxycytidine kinase
VVVLQASADSLIERIRQRGVPMEQSMSEDYLRSLSEAYTDYFHHYDQSPLLIVNTDQLNPIDREKDFDALIQQIANYRGRRSFFNALHD